MFRETLLQSPLWQAFQEKNSRTCIREQAGLAVVETLPIVGQYFYFPRFPLFDSVLVKEPLLALARKHQAGWMRMEPENEEVLATLRELFGEKCVVVAPHDVQPREILLMDITSSEEELLAAMKSKTRYNIRLAEKHGVSVRFSREGKDMEMFIDLIYATTERKAIRPHPKQYYRNFFATFSPEQCVLALAEHEGKVLAANLLVFFDSVAYYLHGGSSAEGRHLMAPFLLQFASIREAKRRGMTQYNFGGVKTINNQPAYRPGRQSTINKNSWEGITRFKQGFAPATESIVFPGAYDIIVSPWRYRAYRSLAWLQKIRKAWR